MATQCDKTAKKHPLQLYQELLARPLVHVGGKLSDLIASIQGWINRYPAVAEKAIVFDKYKDISANDHERMRHAGEFVINYELSITSPLPK